MLGSVATAPKSGGAGFVRPRPRPGPAVCVSAEADISWDWCCSTILFRRMSSTRLTSRERVPSPKQAFQRRFSSLILVFLARLRPAKIASRLEAAAELGFPLSQAELQKAVNEMDTDRSGYRGSVTSSCCACQVRLSALGSVPRCGLLCVRNGEVHFPEFLALQLHLAVGDAGPL